MFGNDVEDDKAGFETTTVACHPKDMVEMWRDSLLVLSGVLAAMLGAANKARGVSMDDDVCKSEMTHISGCGLLTMLPELHRQEAVRSLSRIQWRF